MGDDELLVSQEIDWSRFYASIQDNVALHQVSNSLTYSQAVSGNELYFKYIHNDDGSVSIEQEDPYQHYDIAAIRPKPTGPYGLDAFLALD